MTEKGGFPVLVLDTTGPEPGFGLYAQDCFTTRWLAGRAQGEALAAGISALFEETGNDVASLRGLGVASGPGSYTGVRIGLALVRGLAFPDRLPVYSATTLELLCGAAATVGGPGAWRAVVPARPGEIYTATFDVHPANERLDAVAPAQVCDLDEVLATDGAADLAPRYCALAGDDLATVLDQRIETSRFQSVTRDQKLMALLSGTHLALQQSRGMDAAQVMPTYVGTFGARPNRARVAPGRERL